jgi:hypothetical protein
MSHRLGGALDSPRRRFDKRRFDAHHTRDDAPRRHSGSIAVRRSQDRCSHGADRIGRSDPDAAGGDPPRPQQPVRRRDAILAVVAVIGLGLFLQAAHDRLGDRATTAVFGDADWAVRLGAPLLHLISAIFLGLTANRLFGPRAGFWAAILWAMMPAVWLSSVIIATDAVMMAGWTIALYALVRLREQASWTFALSRRRGRLGLSVEIRHDLSANRFGDRHRSGRPGPPRASDAQRPPRLRSSSRSSAAICSGTPPTTSPPSPTPPPTPTGRARCSILRNCFSSSATNSWSLDRRPSSPSSPPW